MTRIDPLALCRHGAKQCKKEAGEMGKKGRVSKNI